MKRPIAGGIALGLLLGLALIQIPSCASAEHQFWTEESKILQKEVAKKRAELLASPEGGEGAKHAAEWMEKMEPILSSTQKHLAMLEAKEDAETADVVTAIGSVLSDVLPVPFNLAPWALALGAGAWGRRKKSQALNIAASIQAAKKDGVVDFNDPVTVAKLNGKMSDGARNIVDIVTK